MEGPRALGHRTGRAFGTFATLLTTEAAALEQAHALLTAELLAVDAACSRFRRGAELWRVNHARGRPVRVSPLLGEALAVALAAARLTDGDVDPTCGTSLVRLGYDRDFARARRHTSALRQPAAPAPGWLSVEFNQVLGEVRVPAGTVLDLGATAKALAADRAATAIAAELGCGVLVNLGGDIRVAGPAPDGGWGVGIADDVGFDGGHGTGADHAVMIHTGGLATSGTAVRSWRRGSVRLHHIIVPATGLPARSCWRGQRGRGDLRGREHGEHGGDPAQRARDGLAGRARPARAAGAPRRHRGDRRRLAVRPVGRAGREPR